MVTIQKARETALSFAGAEELPHFERASFRVKKKIFATLDEKAGRVMVKLSLIDQSVFCSFNKTIIYPVPGGWGTKGATYVELKTIKLSMLKDAMRSAWKLISKK